MPNPVRRGKVGSVIEEKMQATLRMNIERKGKRSSLVMLK